MIGIHGKNVEWGNFDLGGVVGVLVVARPCSPFRID